MQSIWCVSLHKQFLYVVFLFFKPFTVNLRGGKSHLKKRISSPIWAFLKHLAESPSMCMTWEVQAGYFKLPVGIICKAKEFRYNYAGFFFLMLPVLDYMNPLFSHPHFLSPLMRSIKGSIYPLFTKFLPGFAYNQCVVSTYHIHTTLSTENNHLSVCQECWVS